MRQRIATVTGNCCSVAQYLKAFANDIWMDARVLKVQPTNKATIVAAAVVVVCDTPSTMNYAQSIVLGLVCRLLVFASKLYFKTMIRSSLSYCCVVVERGGLVGGIGRTT